MGKTKSILKFTLSSTIPTTLFLVLLKLWINEWLLTLVDMQKNVLSFKHPLLSLDKRGQLRLLSLSEKTCCLECCWAEARFASATLLIPLAHLSQLRPIRN